mgnify:CR=1 FL=1
MTSKNNQKPKINEIFPTHINILEDMLNQSKNINKDNSYQDKINELYSKLEEGNLTTEEYEMTLNKIDDLRREKATNPNINGRIVINLPSDIQSIDKLKKTTNTETENANKIIDSIQRENEMLMQEIDDIKNKIENNNTYIGSIVNQKSLNDVAKPIIEGEKPNYEAEQFYRDFMWQKSTGLFQSKTINKIVVKYPDFSYTSK